MPAMGGECLKRSRRNLAVIFVHGILSDGEQGWMNANETSWPRLLADEHQVDPNVYSFSYRSDVFSQTYSLSDVVASLREFFNLDDLWSKKVIIFVCHSMGGIAVRRFIVANQAKFIESHPDIGLFLVASPTLGSRDANAVSFFARMLRNSQAEALRFSQSNAWLNDLNTDFITLKESKRLSIHGKELVEDEPIKLLGVGLPRQTVEPWSAAVYFGEPFKVPFSDHISIAKPKDRLEIQHRLLVRFILDMENRPHYRDSPPGRAVSEFDRDEAHTALSALNDAARQGTPISQDAVVAFHHALIETRRYLAILKQPNAKPDPVAEISISSLWMEAAGKLYPFNPQLSNLCMIKGNGWMDDSVWDDPRYKDLPLKLNDMMASMMVAGGEQARDIVDGECEIDAVSRRTRVMLPAFRAQPTITLSRKADGAGAEPTVASVSPDQFTITIASDDQAGKWAWRARGTLIN